jgi:hypothetical protein
MLRRRLLAAVATAALLAPLPPAQADDPPAPVGRPCSFLVSTNPFADEGKAGQVNGGPVVVPGYDVSLRCSIHVDDAWRHADPAAAAAATPPTPSVAVLAPTPVWYDAPDYVEYLCTEVSAGGTTWYWTGEAWSTDPASPCGSSSCRLYDECLFRLLEDVYALGEHLPEPARDIVWDPVFGYVGCWWVGWYCPVFDWVLCASFQYLQPGVPGVVEFREDGDVYVLGEWFWDCPPYGPYEEW